MTFRDTAVAAYEAHRAAAEAAKAAAEAAARTALVDKALVTVVPTLTDPAGKVPVAPKDFTVSAVDTAAGFVVLTAPDESVSLLVRGESVRVTAFVSGRWVDNGTLVSSLADVGKALA